MIESTLDFVAGTSKKIPRTLDIADILPDTLEKAWLTVKRSLDDDDEGAVLQKTITLVLNEEQGQIENAGDEDADASFYFLLSSDETLALWTDNPDDVSYFYDIKVLSSSGASDVPERGRLNLIAPVTRVNA